MFWRWKVRSPTAGRWCFWKRSSQSVAVKRGEEIAAPSTGIAGSCWRNAGGESEKAKFRAPEKLARQNFAGRGFGEGQAGACLGDCVQRVFALTYGIGRMRRVLGDCGWDGGGGERVCVCAKSSKRWDGGASGGGQQLQCSAAQAQRAAAGGRQGQGAGASTRIERQSWAG